MTVSAPLSEIAKKVLHVKVSPMFEAVLDFALANPTPRITPQITALAVTSDGFLMDWNTSRPTKEGLIGHVKDFERNFYGVCTVCGLSREEATTLLAEAYTRITDWRTPRIGRDPNQEPVKKV